jgi:hypothetical protein
VLSDGFETNPKWYWRDQAELTAKG